MWVGAGSPPVTACQNETGWPSAIIGCSMLVVHADGGDVRCG